MKVTGYFLNILSGKNEYKKEDLFPDSKMKELISHIPPQKLEDKGKQLFEAFMEQGENGFENHKAAFIDFYRIFSFYLKDNQTGTVKSLEYRKGYMKLAENLKVPCDLVIGVLKGMMTYFKSKAVSVKHSTCKGEENLFSEYEITWMVSNVR